MSESVTPNDKNNQQQWSMPTPSEPKKKLPEWVNSFKDFLKQLFVTPLALLQRIAQRLALGKEGAAAAEKAAENLAKETEMKKAFEKDAERIDDELNALVARDRSDPNRTDNIFNFKECSVFVPEVSRADLKYAITVTCENDAKFTVYVDQNDQLVSNNMVPAPIITQLKTYMKDVILHDRMEEPAEPAPEQPVDEQPAPPTPDTIHAGNGVNVKEYYVKVDEKAPDSAIKHCVELSLDAPNSPQIIADITDVDTTKRVVLQMDGMQANCSIHSSGAIQAEFDERINVTPEQQALLARAVTAIFKDSPTVSRANLMESISDDITAAVDCTKFYITPETDTQKSSIIHIDPDEYGKVAARIRAVTTNDEKATLEAPPKDRKTIVGTALEAKEPLVCKLTRVDAEITCKGAREFTTFQQGSRGVYCIEMHEKGPSPITIFTTPPTSAHIQGVMFMQSDTPISSQSVEQMCRTNSAVLEIARQPGYNEPAAMEAIAQYFSKSHSTKYISAVMGDIQCTLTHNKEGMQCVEAHFVGNKEPNIVCPLPDMEEGNPYLEAVQRAMIAISDERDDKVTTPLDEHEPTAVNIGDEELIL